MKFEIRKIDKNYITVKVEYWGTIIDLGVMSLTEAKEFAETLDGVVEDLNNFINQD